MMDNFINEQLLKNNVLIDECNICDTNCIEKFIGNKEIGVVPFLKYGYIYIIVKGIVQDIVVKYDNIQIKRVSQDGEYIIPVNYIKDSSIYISGECDCVVLRVYGAKFKDKQFAHLMPMNKMICVGNDNCIVNSYTSFSDVLNAKYVEYKKLFSNQSVQTYVQDNICGLGLLDCNNGLVFSNSFDGFENKVKVCDGDVSGAIFVQKINLNSIVFIYLRGGKVYSKVYNYLSGEFGSENVIYTVGNNIKLIYSVVNCFNSMFFVIKTSVGVAVYVIKSSFQIEKVYEGKFDYIQVFENEDNIKFVLYNKYSIRLLEFNCNESKSGSAMLEYKNSSNYTNLHGVLECENKYIYTNLSGEKFVENM